MNRRAPSSAIRLAAVATALGLAGSACDYKRVKHVEGSSAPGTPPPANQPTFLTLESGLFKQDCTSCHTSSDAQGGVALDSYAALAGSHGGQGPVFTPGSSANSGVYKQIASGQMPLTNPGHLSNPAMLDLLKRWIDLGGKEGLVVPAAFAAQTFLGTTDGSEAADE